MYVSRTDREWDGVVSQHVCKQVQVVDNIGVDDWVPGVKGMEGAEKDDHLLRQGAGVRGRQGNRGLPSSLPRLSLIHGTQGWNRSVHTCNYNHSQTQHIQAYKHSHMHRCTHSYSEVHRQTVDSDNQPNMHTVKHTCTRTRVHARTYACMHTHTALRLPHCLSVSIHHTLQGPTSGPTWCW